MSTKRQLDQALRRAENRDRKRRTRMAVSGKSVFTLAKAIGSGTKRKTK
ncbi:MAG TPA: hypothetical protein VLF41_02370 [Candidatus Nanoarchaeia archaeon]|nr:hypothetical protein [Candidatus Nanoarchaeia archaeon]